jgi:hypothetical protein
MGEVGLGRLRVIKSTMSDSTPGSTYCERSAVELSTGSISVLGCLVDYLVEGGEDIVSKLYFGDSGMSCNCKTNGKAKNTLFRKRSVEHPVNTVSFAEVGCASENTSELDVLSEYFGAG